MTCTVSQTVYKWYKPFLLLPVWKCWIFGWTPTCCQSRRNVQTSQCFLHAGLGIMHQARLSVSAPEIRIWFKQYLFRDNWETIQVLYKSPLSWALPACCVAGEGGEGFLGAWTDRQIMILLHLLTVAGYKRILCIYIWAYYLALHICNCRQINLCTTKTNMVLCSAKSSRYVACLKQVLKYSSINV